MQQQQQQLAIQQLEELQKQQVGQDGSSPYVGTQFVHVEMAGDQQFLLYADWQRRFEAGVSVTVRVYIMVQTKFLFLSCFIQFP